MITHEHFLNLIVREPENTQHRLVYADWLEEQGDPRAEFIRLRFRLPGMTMAEGEPLRCRLRQLRELIDPTWLAVMDTLALPWRLYPFGVLDEEPLPLLEPLGYRGRLVTFGSQFRSPELNSLAADLRLAATLGLGNFPYHPSHLDLMLAEFSGPASPDETSEPALDPYRGFLLAEPPPGDPPYTARSILGAVKASRFQSAHIPSLDVTDLRWRGNHPVTLNDEVHTDPTRQYLYDFPAVQPAPGWSPFDISGDHPHQQLRRAVQEARLWYILLKPDPDPESGYYNTVLLFAVGVSKFSGNLIGIVTQHARFPLPD